MRSWNRWALRAAAALVLLLSLCLGTVALAGGGTTVTEVDITIPTPADGMAVGDAQPVISAKTLSGPVSNAVFLSFEWTGDTGSGFSALTDTDTFRSGGFYRLQMPELYTAGGYSLASDVVVRVNGEEVLTEPTSAGVRFEGETLYVPYDITFDMNGRGTAPVPRYNDAGRMVMPDDPTASGYCFMGWYTDSALTQKVSFPAEFHADSTLYAAWKRHVDQVEITVEQAVYTQPSRKLTAQYAVDGSTDNTKLEFTQYGSADGVSHWEEVYFHSGLTYGRYYKIDLSVALTDPQDRILDADTEIVLKGAEGVVSRDVRYTSEAVLVTVVYYVPPRTFTLKLDTDGHAPAIADRKVDALSRFTPPDLSAFSTDEWRFAGWYYLPEMQTYVQADTLVWCDMAMKAQWDHYYLVTFEMSADKKTFTGRNKDDTRMRQSEAMKVMDEAAGEYYIEGYFADAALTVPFDESVKLSRDVTVYVKCQKYVSALDVALTEPQVGQKQDPAARLISIDPAGSMTLSSQGTWMECKNADDRGRAMADGEAFKAGYRYIYRDLTFELTDWAIYRVPFDGPAVTVNGKVPPSCRVDLSHPAAILRFTYDLPGSVTFDLMGHGKAIPQQKVAPGETVTEPETPREDGWLFDGWYTDQACTRPYDFASAVNGDMTLYAHWLPRVSRVDADFTLPWLHFTAGSAVDTLTPDTREARLSATRILWKKNTGSGWVRMEAGEEFLPDTDYRAEFTVIADSAIPFADDARATVRGSSEGVTASLDANGSLKVVYTRRLLYSTHTVTFDTEGKGTDVPAQTVEEGLTAARPADPAAEGFVFGGWTTDAAHTQRYDFSTPLVEDITLYAHWLRPIRRVTVTLPAIMAGQTAPKTVQLSTEYGNMGLRTYEVSVAWQKDGSAYNPWAGALRFEAGQHYTVRSFTIPTAGADWILADDVEIVSNLGTVEVVSVSPSAAAVKLHVTAQSGPTPGVPTLYTVTFDTRGRGTVEAQTVPVKGKAEKPADPAAAGCTFTGWYTDEACTARYDFDTPVTGNMTLYAGWEEAPANGPATGDGESPALWMALMAASLAALGLMAFRRRKAAR